jgi:hypothetical protein
MKSRMFWASLLAGAISMGALPAAEQLRQEAVEVPLTDLKGHCRKMLDLQIAVHDGTKSLHKAIDSTADKKPRPRDKEVLSRLSNKLKESLDEAMKTLEMLNKDGAAVAFTEVFQDLCKDMKHVQRRLEMGDVGPATQALEKDVIDTLTEMVDAVKRR